MTSSRPLFRQAVALAAAMTATALFASAAQAQSTAEGAAPALRVCADPDNLPFTKADGPERGLYLEVAELLAKRLQMPVEYTWWYTHNQRRALRNTIAKDECDITFLPANADYRVRGLEKTQPFIQVSYAVVAAPGFSFSSMNDLKQRRLGVQFRSTPQLVLAAEGGFNTTTFVTTEELFAALDRGEIDAALMWGPTAGYENQRRHQGRYRVTPMAGHDFDGQVSVAVRRDKEGLARRIDAALGDIRGEIRSRAERYGFPVMDPVRLNAVTRPDAAPLTLRDDDPTAARRFSQAMGLQGWSVVRTNAPAPAAAGTVDAGKSLINGDCSHCHGSGGMSPVVERDLRRMKRRYDDKWEQVARETIRNGRVASGMPVGGGMKLSDGDIDNLVAYLRTIQRD